MPNTLRFLFAAATLLVTATLSAQDYTTTQWEPVDVVLEADPGEADPFSIYLVGNFTGPDGQTMSVPGFWDGGNRFVIRFAPPSEGEWSYSSKSPIKPLNSKSGKIAVAPPAPGQHGPIGIHPDDPTRFAHADGTPYFPIAFEIDWLFAIDAENPDGIPKTEQLLRTVGANGFNQVVMNIFAYDVRWPKDPNLPPRYEYGSPRVFPYGGDNTNPDHSTLSIEFFQRFDRVVRELDKHGQAAHLMIYVWNKLVNWPEADSAEDNLYFDYVVKRYQAFPHLIWDISKEATGYGHNDKSYITRRIERLRELDGHNRLVTVHDYGYCNQFPDTVDFISIQNWHAEIWHIMRDVVKKHPAKPVFNIEHGGYERGPYHVFTGNYGSPVSNLERAYKIIFAGASIAHYWQDTSWNVVIHDIENLPEVDQPKLEYYRYLAEFIEEQNVHELKPTIGATSSGICLSNNDDFYLHWLPEENDSIVVRQRKGYEGGTLHFQWFDPLTGTYTDEESVQVEKWTRLTLPKPNQMRVLVCRFEAAKS